MSDGSAMGAATTQLTDIKRANAIDLLPYQSDISWLRHIRESSGIVAGAQLLNGRGHHKWVEA